MRDSEVVYHENISLFPAIEYQVPPHCIPDMCHSAAWNLRAVSKLRVHANMITPTQGQEEETEQPHYDGEEKKLEAAKTTPYPIILLVEHRPVEHL
jgi:hypothetical protein